MSCFQSRSLVVFKGLRTELKVASNVESKQRNVTLYGPRKNSSVYFVESDVMCRGRRCSEQVEACRELAGGPNSKRQNSLSLSLPLSRAHSHSVKLHLLAHKHTHTLTPMHALSHTLRMQSLFCNCDVDEQHWQ